MKARKPEKPSTIQKRKLVETEMWLTMENLLTERLWRDP